MSHINFYSKYVLIIALVLQTTKSGADQGDTQGVCTNPGNADNIDCKEYVPGIEYLQTSLFPYVPPCLKFSMKERLSIPWEIKKYLKWKDLHPGKTGVIKTVLGSSGFTGLSRGDKQGEHQWLGAWQSGPSDTLYPYQKYHGIPNGVELNNKMKMCINVKNGMKILGNGSFDFIPETYVLPTDMKEFKTAYQRSGNHLWLLKPPTGVWARGMEFIRSWKDVPKKRSSVVVQKFLEKQYLTNGRKVDVRFYVLTISYNPLRVYMANEYIVMTARSNYTVETGDPCVLLVRHADTNPELCSHIIKEDPTSQTIISSKAELFAQMNADGFDAKQFEEKLNDGVIKTILSTLRPGHERFPNMNRYNAFQLWGADTVIDEHVNPVILEFNAFPSTKILKGHGEDFLDFMKKTLMSEAFSTVGYNLPPFISAKDKVSVLRSLNATHILETPAFDERLYQINLSEEAKLKQQKYQFGSNGANVSYRDSILETLTPDDTRQIILAEDELSRSKKGFTRLYPSIGMNTYMPLSKFDPYYDMLFDAWESKYHLNRAAGIHRLQLLAQHKYHLLP